MSYQAVRWALDIELLDCRVKLVLVALAERADAAGGKCHPGITELARRASVNRRVVVAAIRKLQELGAITVTRAMAKVGKRRAVNRYMLVVGIKTVVPPKRTTLVQAVNQVGSELCTGTATESPVNLHSVIDVAAHRGERDAAGTPATLRMDRSKAKRWPDGGMTRAAGQAGYDPDDVRDWILDKRNIPHEEVAPSPTIQSQLRGLWFAILRGQIEDFA